MFGLIVIAVVVVAACLGTILRDAPERRLEQHPRGWFAPSPRR